MLNYLFVLSYDWIPIYNNCILRLKFILRYNQSFSRGHKYHMCVAVAKLSPSQMSRMAPPLLQRWDCDKELLVSQVQVLDSSIAFTKR